MKLSMKMIYYYLAAVAVLVSLIYFKNKSEHLQDKCSKITLESSPLDVGRVLGAPVETQKRNGSTVLMFETSVMMDTVITAEFSDETGKLLFFQCGDYQLQELNPQN